MYASKFFVSLAYAGHVVYLTYYSNTAICFSAITKVE